MNPFNCDYFFVRENKLFPLIFFHPSREWEENVERSTAVEIIRFLCLNVNRRRNITKWAWNSLTSKQIFIYKKMHDSWKNLAIFISTANGFQSIIVIAKISNPNKCNCFFFHFVDVWKKMDGITISTSCEKTTTTTKLKFSVCAKGKNQMVKWKTIWLKYIVVWSACNNNIMTQLSEYLSTKQYPNKL